MYRYRISKSIGSSRKYGPCEICGEYAHDIHIQTREEHCNDADGEFWAHAGNRFGHMKCLETIQTQPIEVCDQAYEDGRDAYLDNKDPLPPNYPTEDVINCWLEGYADQKDYVTRFYGADSRT